MNQESMQRSASSYLLQDLHGQLGGESTARDELVERVGEGHADSVAGLDGRQDFLEWVKGRTRSRGRIRSMRRPWRGCTGLSGLYKSKAE